MKNVKEQDGEFSRNPGDIFVSYGLVHKLKEVLPDESPTGNESEKYIAECTAESQSWAMPAAQIESALFIPPEDIDTNPEWERCTVCFAAETNNDSASSNWRNRLPGLMHKLFPLEEQNKAIEVLRQIQMESTHGDVFYTSVLLDINTDRNKADLSIRYGYAHREPEEMLSSHGETSVTWPDNQRYEGNHIINQIQRGIYLSSELHLPFTIQSIIDHAQYDINRGEIRESTGASSYWQDRLPELVHQPLLAEDQKIGAALAEQIDKDFNQGDLCLTSVQLDISTGNGADLYVGYEDNSRLRETGPEDTMSSSTGAKITWPGEEQDDSNHIIMQIQRGVFLSDTLHMTFIITSYTDHVMYYVSQGEARKSDYRP
jgi:hypothetical protein